jgi:nucleotide-binding universal stress UspA family protein
MVVMGAYGRNWLSGLFKPATAGLLLKTINLPFFITHH